MSSADDTYEQQNDALNDAPAGDAKDNDYVSRPGQKQAAIPVQSDDQPVESGLTGDQDTDEQLARDDQDAIDETNIVEGKTRGAAKPKGTYQEPGDEEGLEATT